MVDKELIEKVAKICWDEKDWTGCECYEDWLSMIYATLKDQKVL